MLKMGQEMSFGKLKILFINIFAILYKATALNVHRLHSNLRQVNVVVNASGTEELWTGEIFTTLISGLLVMRFILCFIGLASNIVAIYPLLTNSQPELLMPTIIVQIIDNVLLNFYEIALGYTCIKYLHPESYAVFVIFLAKMMIKTICCVSMLNLFSDKHRQLATQDGGIESSPSSLTTENSFEFEIRNQHFRPIC